MQYKCISKVKRKGLFNSIRVGDILSIEEYNKLPPEEKIYFEENYQDESFVDRVERIIKKADGEEN